MKNKKGFLRIIEAFIAVLIVAGVIIVILAGRAGNRLNKDDVVYNLQKVILEEVSGNRELREAVLKAVDSDSNGIINEDNEEEAGEENYAKIKDFVFMRVPKVFEFEVQICVDIGDICGPREYKKEMYAKEIVISSTLQDYNPRKLKLFMWEK